MRTRGLLVGGVWRAAADGAERDVRDPANGGAPSGLQSTDAVVLGDKPLAPAFTQEAVRRGFVVGQAANFPSMARAGAAQGGAVGGSSLVTFWRTRK